ncbi:MAG: hypothetical protein V1930_04990 [Pseudomonadota bacterium]
MPQKTHSYRLVNLKGFWDEGYIALRGEVHGLQGPISPQQVAESITGCRVYVASYAVERTPCPGCPIQYRDFLLFGKEAMTEGGVYCKIPAKGKKGQTYFLKVHLIGPGESMGPPSEEVQVTAE